MEQETSAQLPSLDNRNRERETERERDWGGKGRKTQIRSVEHFLTYTKTKGSLSS